MIGESLQVLKDFAIMVIVMISFFILLRRITNIPGYIFRKMLHMIAVFAIIPILYGTESWTASLSFVLVLIVLIVIILSLVERFSFYKAFFVEKEKHEVVTSFVLLFSMIAFFIVVFWGILGEEFKYIPVVATMSWGPGDAMAAIIGITYGKKKLSGKWIEGTKSVEGCVAMALTSILCTSVSLYLIGPYDLMVIIPVSIVIGIIAMFVELFTKRGLDTITVPLVSSVLLFIINLLA